MVSIPDPDSGDPSSNLGETWLFSSFLNKYEKIVEYSAIYG